MRQDDFVSVVLDSDILAKDEIISIIKCLSAAAMPSMGFPETKGSCFKIFNDAADLDL